MYLRQPTCRKREQLQIHPAVQHPDERNARRWDGLDVGDGLRGHLALECLQVDRVPNGVGARVPATLVVGEALGRREDDIHLVQHLLFQCGDDLGMRPRECGNLIGDVIDRERLAHPAHRALVQRVVHPQHADLRPIAARPPADPPPLDRELQAKHPRHPMPEVKQRQRGEQAQRRRHAPRATQPGEQPFPPAWVAQRREERHETLDVQHRLFARDLVGDGLLDDP